MFTKKSQTGLFFVLLVSMLFVLQFGFPSSSLAVKQGGVLKIALGMGPNKIDPPNSYGGTDMMIGCHVFEKLVAFEYDEKAKGTVPRPVLAERWKKSEDGKIWTFYLKKGVKFHDGTAFNAEAVKFIMDRTVADKPRTLYGRDLRYVVDHTETVDEYTVAIHCKKVTSTFLHLIGQPCFNILSPASLKKYGNKVGRHPTGTGPFKFVKWVPGEYVELAANKEYRGGRPNLDGIIWRFVPDNSARMNMLQTGEIDVAYNVPIPDHERLIKTGKIDIVTWPTATILRFYMDCAYTPTDEVKVRQAIKLAIDTKAIVRDILEGKGNAADSAVAPYSWGFYNADPATYDPEKAKTLLTEAGWIDKDGDGIRKKGDKKLTLTIYAPQPGRYPMDRECVLAIQEFLREVGFDCKVRFMEFAAFLKALYKTKDQTTGGAYFVSWSSRTDAWFVLYSKFHSSYWYPDKKHTTFYRNTAYDKLLDKAALTLDNQKRFELYKKAQEILAVETPTLHLWVMHYMLAKRKYVHGLVYKPIPVNDTLHAREAWIE